MSIVSTRIVAPFRKAASLLSLLVFLVSASSVCAQVPFGASDRVVISAEVGTSQYGHADVENLTNANLKLKATISGSDAANFSLAWAEIMLYGDTLRLVSFPILFQPTEAREYNAMLTLTDGTQSVEVKLIGKGALPIPKPLRYFGKTTMSATLGFGSSSSELGLINDNTVGSITITKIWLQGSSKGAFELLNDSTEPPYTITPGNTFNFGVGLVAKAEGTYSDSVRVAYTGVDGKEAELVIPITGLVFMPNWYNCANIEGDSTVFGVLDADQTMDRIYQIANYNAAELTITKIAITGDKNFTIVNPPTVPLVLSSNEKAQVVVRFNSGNENWKNLFYAQLSVEARSDSGSCSRNMLLQGATYYRGNPVDTSHVSLFPEKQEKINLKTKAGQDSTLLEQVIIFQNSEVKTKVVNVSLKDGEHYSLKVLYPSEELPITLEPYSYMMVRVTMFATEPGNYHDQLIVTTENGLTSTVYDLEGVIEPVVAGVKPVSLANGVSIFVQPNPARGPLTISLVGAERAAVEVYNMLGEVVYSGVASSNWTWSGNNNNGSALPNGAYVIRATGQNNRGKEFVTSTRVVLTR